MRERIPPDSAPWPLTIEDYERLYRNCDPAAVLAEVLERAATLEPSLNAFAHLTPAAPRVGEPVEGQPLRGVPVGVKDLIDVAGIPTRCGSKASSPEPAAVTAPVVARLEAAGAALIGKTNLLEYAYGAVHPEVGDTRNPWDPARTAGGSSGGSAAAVAAGVCPIALGSDTGGSIRIPAAYCGVVGFKPTFGRLPLDGVMPLAYSLDHVGPLARTCRDARRAWSALTGEAIGEASLLSRVFIGVPRRYVERVALQPGVRAAFEGFLAALESAGAVLREVEVPHIEEANPAVLDLLLPEASVIHERNMEDRAHLYGPATLEQLRAGFRSDAVSYVRAQRFQERFREAVTATLTGIGVLAMPTAPWVAPAEDPAVSGDEGLDEMHFTGPFNLSGHPAVSLPWGLSDSLPVGVQLVGPLGRDAELLALAEQIEALAPPLGRPALHAC